MFEVVYWASRGRVSLGTLADDARGSSRARESVSLTRRRRCVRVQAGQIRLALAEAGIPFVNRNVEVGCNASAACGCDGAATMGKVLFFRSMACRTRSRRASTRCTSSCPCSRRARTSASFSRSRACTTPRATPWAAGRTASCRGRRTSRLSACSSRLVPVRALRGPVRTLLCAPTCVVRARARRRRARRPVRGGLRRRRGGAWVTR